MKNFITFWLLCLLTQLPTAILCEDSKNYGEYYNNARQLERESSKNQDLWPLALTSYLNAYNQDPTRAEPLIRIAQHYYISGQNNLAYIFAKNACTIATPEQNGPENELYTYTRYDILGICAWYAQAYDEGEAAIKKALEYDPDNDHLKNNLRFYIERKCQEHPKIVGLLPARNESAIIEQCLHALSFYTDAIIYLDDASDDNSIAIVEACAKKYNIEKIIKKEVWLRDEPADRNALLKAGREIGGTHFIVIDADEIFTANCRHNDMLRERIKSLKPGDRLLLNWIHLWKSANLFRSDEGWRYRFKDFIFCDDGYCSYNSDFIHTSRTPLGLSGKSHYLDCNTYGMLHFQFINWANLIKKQSWYKCLERIRLPAKSIDAINERYLFSMDTSNVETSPIEIIWVSDYDFYNPNLFNMQEEWRTVQIKEWVQEYGKDYFNGLDFWDLDIENV